MPLMSFADLFLFFLSRMFLRCQFRIFDVRFFESERQGSPMNLLNLYQSCSL